MVAKMQANAKVALNLQKKKQNAFVFHRKFVDFSRVKINDLQLEHYCVITSMSMHMCAYKLIPSLKRQFIYILLSTNSYYSVWEFVLLLPQTHTYIQRATWSRDKSTYSCCSPWIPCKDPLSIAFSSLSLGISSGDIDVGSTFTKNK